MINGNECVINIFYWFFTYIKVRVSLNKCLIKQQQQLWIHIIAIPTNVEKDVTVCVTSAF